MKIIQAPNKILEKKSKSIDKIDGEILKLIAKMFETLDGAKGVGLSAPQIGKSVSLAVVGFEPTPEMKKEKPEMKPIPKTVFINPKIIWNSQNKLVEKEGCLSCKEVEVDIPRYKKIHVEFLNEKGKKQKMRARSYIARVIQHEIDHLNGRLITDYIK